MIQHQNIVNMLGVKEKENKKEINNKKCQKDWADGKQKKWGYTRLSKEKKQTGKKDWGGWEAWRKLFQRKRVRWRVSEGNGEWVCSALSVSSLCYRGIDGAGATFCIQKSSPVSCTSPENNHLREVVQPFHRHLAWLLQLQHTPHYSLLKI